MTAPRRRPAAPAIALAISLVFLGACVPQPVGRSSPTSATPSESASAPTPTPAPTGATPSPSFVRPTPTPLPTFLGYVVTAGDTLEGIAKAHRTTVASLAFWNRTRYPSLDPDAAAYEPDRIEVGWVLFLVPDAEIDEDATFAEPSARRNREGYPAARSSRNGKTYSFDVVLTKPNTVKVTSNATTPARMSLSIRS